MQRTLLSIWVVLSIAAGAAWAAEKIVLKTKYTPGTYVSTMSTHMDTVTQMAQGMSITQKVKMLIITEIAVQKPGPEGQKIEMTYKRIKQSITGGPISMSYDSEDPPDQQDSMLSGIYKGLLGTKLTMLLGPDGRVVEVRGFDEMWGKLAKESPGAANIMAQMKKQFGQQTLEQTVSAADQYLPGKPVAKGESWVVAHKQEIPMMGLVDVTQNCKLTDIIKTPAGKIAVIDISSKIASDTPATMPAESTMPVSISKTDIRQSGTMKMNVKLGMMTQMKLDQKSLIEMQGPGAAGDSPTRMTVTTRGTTEVTVQPGKYTPPDRPVARPASRPAEVDF